MTVAAVAVALALALAGCGFAVPQGNAPSPAATATTTTNEQPSPATPAPQAVGGAATAPDAVHAFATAYINWTAETVGADMRTLAASSVGQARSAMELAAAQTAGDYELRQGGIANSGAVEAVAPLPGHDGEYVVVTRETTTATNTTAYQGLRPAWHVALATVSQLSRGQWVVSGWQPES